MYVIAAAPAVFYRKTLQFVVVLKRFIKGVYSELSKIERDSPLESVRTLA